MTVFKLHIPHTRIAKAYMYMLPAMIIVAVAILRIVFYVPLHIGVLMNIFQTGIGALIAKLLFIIIFIGGSVAALQGIVSERLAFRSQHRALPSFRVPKWTVSSVILAVISIIVVELFILMII